MPLTEKNKEEHLIQDEPVRKQKPMSSTVSRDRFEKYKKNGMAWKETIEEVEGWLDYGLIDGLLETISKNKEVIAVELLQPSAQGFIIYVSQKLRSMEDEMGIQQPSAVSKLLKFTNYHNYFDLHEDQRM